MRPKSTILRVWFRRQLDDRRGDASASVPWVHLPVRSLFPFSYRLPCASSLHSASRCCHAIGDRSDERVQASFSAQLGGVPVLGLIGVSTQGGTARAVVLFDAHRAFPNSIARLVRVATSRTSGGGGAADVALTRTPIPDGSGNIGLASGWVIRHAYKGAIDVQGPLPGSGMSLGAVIPVPYTSSDPAQAMVMQTAQTTRETGELLTGASGGGQRAFDGVNAGWGQYIPGVATLEDPSRSRSEVDHSFADNVVRHDPPHFRIVPTSELVP